MIEIEIDDLFFSQMFLYPCGAPATSDLSLFQDMWDRNDIVKHIVDDDEDEFVVCAVFVFCSSFFLGVAVMVISRM